jgi:4'-phosphopantetheinyl transferase
MLDFFPWLLTPKWPALAENELHLWRASLDISPELLDRFEKTLSTAEKDRADKFLVTHARERFIAGRGILRDLLAAYLEIEPRNVDFSYGDQGKPALSPTHKSEIRFSVSHSQSMALFAIGESSEVGVDIETVKTNFKGMEIASHFFSEEEIAALAKLPPEVQVSAFFSCWTKKEAYVKARGQGLSIPLRSFTVNFADSKQLLKDEQGAVWSCFGLEPAAGFLGAVVVAGENWRVKSWAVVQEKSPV